MHLGRYPDFLRWYVACFLSLRKINDARVIIIIFFAISGNLALALKEWRDTDPMIPSKSFIHLCTAIQCCLDDRNEKVRYYLVVRCFYG